MNTLNFLVRILFYNRQRYRIANYKLTLHIGTLFPIYPLDWRVYSQGNDVQSFRIGPLPITIIRQEWVRPRWDFNKNCSLKIEIRLCAVCPRGDNILNWTPCASESAWGTCKQCYSYENAMQLIFLNSWWQTNIRY